MRDKDAQRDIVLVVDDSPETVRLLTDAIDTAGMIVMVALDGAAALKIAGRLTPSIVLMDAVMPVMDGFETCRQLKQLAGFDNVPVLFMTGLSETEHIVRGFEAGGADYVTKPIVIQEMLARIRVHLANAKLTHSARAALDVAGRFLIATDREGRINWFTPRARNLLETRFPMDERGVLRLPSEMLGWLNTRGPGSTDTPRDATVNLNNGESILLAYVGQTESAEILLRITEASPSDPITMLRARFGLTGREAEVLSWIARGKSNRDIAAILTLSPRTVDKHLEIIYTKLTVENRTAAAAMALQALGA